MWFSGLYSPSPQSYHPSGSSGGSSLSTSCVLPMAPYCIYTFNSGHCGLAYQLALVRDRALCRTVCQYVGSTPSHVADALAHQNIHTLPREREWVGGVHVSVWERERKRESMSEWGKYIIYGTILLFVQVCFSSITYSHSLCSLWSAIAPFCLEFSFIFEVQSSHTMKPWAYSVIPCRIVILTIHPWILLHIWFLLEIETLPFRASYIYNMRLVLTRTIAYLSSCISPL